LALCQLPEMGFIVIATECIPKDTVLALYNGALIEESVREVTVSCVEDRPVVGSFAERQSWAGEVAADAPIVYVRHAYGYQWLSEAEVGVSKATVDASTIGGMARFFSHLPSPAVPACSPDHSLALFKSLDGDFLREIADVDSKYIACAKSYLPEGAPMPVLYRHAFQHWDCCHQLPVVMPGLTSEDEITIATANLVGKVVILPDGRVPQLALVAQRDILEGEQVGFDYGETQVACLEKLGELRYFDKATCQPIAREHLCFPWREAATSGGGMGSAAGGASGAGPGAGGKKPATLVMTPEQINISRYLKFCLLLADLTLAAEWQPHTRAAPGVNTFIIRLSIEEAVEAQKENGEMSKNVSLALSRGGYLLNGVTSNKRGVAFFQATQLTDAEVEDRVKTIVTRHRR
jgi:hypothetical protein